MNYFKKTDGEVYAFDDNQIHLVTKDMIKMTDDEIDQHVNPQNYMSDEEKLKFNRQNMPALSPIEFDLLLDKHDLYDVVQDLISTNRTLKIAYTRALYFSRTDPFIEEARIALGLTHEQVDTMWLS